MSFRCSSCGAAQPDGSRPTVRVIETRSKEYRYRKRRDDDDEDYAGQDGRGTEIVREIRLCEGCAGGGLREYKLR